jgi:hypothetical protein
MNITPKDMTPTTELIEAAKAVIARWDSNDWKAPPTAEGMNRLRAALAHAAELAKKDAEIERLKGLLTIYFNAQQETT